MRVVVAMLLLAVACVSSAPPMRPGGPADPRAPEGPLNAASAELSADSGISRYESGSTPMMGNMQMGGTADGGMPHDMGGMQMGGMGDGGMQHDMGGKKHGKSEHVPVHAKPMDRKMKGMSGMKMDGGMQ